MDQQIKSELQQLADDVDELKKSTNFSKNELWKKHAKEFLSRLDLSQEDKNDFEKLSSSIMYSNESAKYDGLKYFFTLLLRKNIDYKPSPIDDLVSSLRIPGTVISSVPSKLEPIRVSMPNKIVDPQKQRKDKIFIVHGHDEQSKSILDEMLKEMGFETIILHQKANEGKTIIEKLEKYADEVAYAFILLTPDDFGGASKAELNSRARQNVILELGYFFGKLGRENVCCLYKSDVELPSDMHGILYLPFSKSPEECHRQILKELKNVGYEPKS